MKAKIWNKKGWIKITNPDQIKEVINGLLHESQFSVIKFVEHYFEPIGYTALWLLAESHLAIHTFPEEGKAYYELSSCSEKPHYYFTKRIECITT